MKVKKPLYEGQAEKLAYSSMKTSVGPDALDPSVRAKFGGDARRSACRHVFYILHVILFFCDLISLVQYAAFILPSVARGVARDAYDAYKHLSETQRGSGGALLAAWRMRRRP